MSDTPKYPFVRFFASDWLGGTRGLSAVEIGVYITLVASMYERCEPIPENRDRLARLCGLSGPVFARTLAALVQDGKIIRRGGGLWNARVQREFDWRAENSARQKSRVEARWQKHKQKQQAVDTATVRQPVPDPLPDGAIPEARDHTPEDKPDGLSRAHGYPPGAFEEWYQAYPHQVGRLAAQSAFARLGRSKDPPPLGLLMEALAAYVAGKPDDVRWCNPATWLNQGRWHDRPARHTASGAPGPGGKTSGARGAAAAQHRIAGPGPADHFAQGLADLLGERVDRGAASAPSGPALDG